MQGFYDTMTAISCYIQECTACSPVPAELDLFYCFIQGLCSALPSETILHCSSRSALSNDTMQHCGLHSALLNDTCTTYIVAYILFYHVVLYLIILFSRILVMYSVESLSHALCNDLNNVCLPASVQLLCVCLLPLSLKKYVTNCDFFIINYY